MTDPTTGKPVYVAVVHPKTMFPGKNLPPGVMPNIYLSRFIAMEPHAPYSIIARSGMFCLGYPKGKEEDSTHRNPLVGVKMQQLEFAGDQYECPRIHFVTGLVDKLDEPDKVLMSYGVSDCMSRTVEVEKSEIARLLWKNQISN
jgi:hypothetical protein